MEELETSEITTRNSQIIHKLENKSIQMEVETNFLEINLYLYHQ